MKSWQRGGRAGIAALAAVLLSTSAALALPGDRGGQVAIDVKIIEVDAIHSFGSLGISLDGFKDNIEKLGMGPGNGIAAAAGISFGPPPTSLLPADAIASIEVAGSFLDFSKGKRGVDDSRQDGNLLVLQVRPRVTFGTDTQITLDLSPTFIHLTTDANAPSGDRHRSNFNGFGATIGAGANIMLTPIIAGSPNEMRPFLFFGGRVGPIFGHVDESSTYGVGGGDGRTAWLYNLYAGVGLQVTPNFDIGLSIDWLKIGNAADATINSSGGSSGRDVEAITGTLRATYKFK